MEDQKKNKVISELVDTVRTDKKVSKFPDKLLFNAEPKVGYDEDKGYHYLYVDCIDVRNRVVRGRVPLDRTKK